ncbi:hypothetical protein GCM10009865_29640 [Aeromicrobium ponti]|uniref:Pilus assembly protein Flp/PilA n=1 Tax=Cytobacillus oceanisediminis TaxID=665099 RepID=A0A562JRJ8_9BACI|nr:Flp family type IVb pilin [Cytobacillus oceanisediminis]TWH85817.1 pilus assembly protein Flp/PilA [Cytobacillus oceanisediminis]
MLNRIKGLFIEEEGQGMTEYGMILGLVAVGVIVALVALKGKIVDLFNGISFKEPTL